MSDDLAQAAALAGLHDYIERLEDRLRAARGGCKILSQGDQCDCGLYKRDREIERLREIVSNCVEPCGLCDDKNQEIERLRARLEQLKQINQRRFISTSSFGAVLGDGAVKTVEYRHECTLCGAVSSNRETIPHEIDCPLRNGGDDE